MLFRIHSADPEQLPAELIVRTLNGLPAQDPLVALKALADLRYIVA
ncbi:hypothetical protein ACWGLE_18510 [Streptomyces sp. NPDC055897]